MRHNAEFEHNSGDLDPATVEDLRHPLTNAGVELAGLNLPTLTTAQGTVRIRSSSNSPFGPGLVTSHLRNLAEQSPLLPGSEQRHNPSIRDSQPSRTSTQHISMEKSTPPNPAVHQADPQMNFHSEGKEREASMDEGDPLPKDGPANRFEVLLEEGNSSSGQGEEARIGSEGTEEGSSSSSREDDDLMESEKTEEAEPSQSIKIGDKELAIPSGTGEGKQTETHCDNTIVPDLNKVPSSRDLIIEHNRQEKEK
ncbi:hypothetical protein R1flu_026194 [Riccia fluitans]|uniref:Uncharacterized protein n=1 Tax=Riccia fluitans TaxID=41844 RepID=A0ABD1XI81_9MARC